MSASIQQTVVTYTVGYRSAINSGAFSSDNYAVGGPKIDVDELTLALAPALSRAVLSRERGLMFVDSRQVVTALDLRGKQVKLVLTDTARGSVTWYGYVVDQSDTVDASSDIPIADPADTPTTVNSGRTIYLAYGLEYHLAEVTLQHSVTDAGNVGEIIPFNLSTVGGGIEGNRTASKTGGSYRFASSATNQWTAQDVAEYLVRLFNDATGESWTLGGQASSLANVIDVWRFRAGQNLFACLNDVIGARYGFAWHLTKASDGSEPVINVVSTLDSAYSAGDISIPANPNVATLTLHQSATLERPVYEHIEGAHYDQVIARGGPVRCAFTMHKGDSGENPSDIDYGTIAEGWDTGQQTAYNSATDDESRQLETFRNLWRDFVLPSSWDGYMDTPSVSNYNCIPVVDQSDESFPVDTGTQQTKYFRDWRFDPIVPLKDTSSGAPRWRPPVVIAHDWTAGKYVDLLAPPDGYTPVGVSMLDDRPGIRLVTRFNHQLADDDFSGTSDFTPELDWKDLFITVMAATNERLTWTEAASEAYPGPITKTLTIDVPDAELWFMAGATVTGIDSSGTGLERVGVAGEVVRNDLDILKRVAQAAAAWYNTRRTKLRVPYSHCDLVLDGSGNSRLGHVISETYTGGSVVPTGTIVSKITYRLGATQTSEFQTEWRDIGRSGLLRGVRGDQQPGGRTRGHDYRPRADARAPQIIVPPSPGSVGSITSAIFNPLEVYANSTTSVVFRNDPVVEYQGDRFQLGISGSGVSGLTTTTHVALRVKPAFLRSGTVLKWHLIGSGSAMVDAGASPYTTTSLAADNRAAYPFFIDFIVAKVNMSGGVITSVDQLGWGVVRYPTWTGGLRCAYLASSLYYLYYNESNVFTPGASKASDIYQGLLSSVYTVQLGFSGLTKYSRIGYVETDGSGQITLLYDYTTGINDGTN